MQNFKEIVIYYFSGTGNSQNVAKWFTETAIKNNTVCTAHNIAKIDRKNISKPPENALVVFISPVHGFNYPPVMLNFSFRFPKAKNRVLLMNTRAGMLLGNFNLPGLTGIAFLLSSLVLILKGYFINGFIPVDLPSNWMSLHPTLGSRAIEILHQKNKKKVIDKTQKIISGKKDFRALREIIQDILISPISLLYFLIGRFVLSKSFFASKDCNNCDICINKCPVKAIIKVDNRPYWTFKCESCMRCMSNCPQRAINTAHGFFVGYLFLASFVSGLFFKYFDKLFFKISNILLYNVIQIVLYLALIFVLYLLVHLLMRFKFFERIMVFTSFTKYKFWGKRYKALKNY